MCVMLPTGQPDDEDGATDDDRCNCRNLLATPWKYSAPFPAPLHQKVKEKGKQGWSSQSFLSAGGRGIRNSLEVGGSKGTSMDCMFLCTFMQYMRFYIVKWLLVFLILLAI